MYESIFVKPWPFWVAGLAIGLFVPVFAWVTGKALGVSSGYSELCSVRAPAGPERWKLWFTIGLPLGGLLANLLARGALVTRELPFGATVPIGNYGGVSSSVVFQLALLAFGGVLIGFGARTAGGCTSGHSIVGISIGSISSVVATLAFMLAGFVTLRLLILLSGAG